MQTINTADKASDVPENKKKKKSVISIQQK
jgi:hypothetical protein